jgi:hypothetical protein
MKQIVQLYEAYGCQKAPEAINKFLQDHPNMEIKPGAVTAVPLSFAGGETGHGILVVFSVREEK